MTGHLHLHLVRTRARARSSDPDEKVGHAHGLALRVVRGWNACDAATLLDETARARSGPVSPAQGHRAGSMTLASGWLHEAGDQPHPALRGGSMTLAISWLHDGGETVRAWLHERGDWHAGRDVPLRHRRDRPEPLRPSNPWDSSGPGLCRAGLNTRPLGRPRDKKLWKGRGTTVLAGVGLIARTHRAALQAWRLRLAARASLGCPPSPGAAADGLTGSENAKRDQT
jgi:hypothetical protein